MVQYFILNFMLNFDVLVILWLGIFRMLLSLRSNVLLYFTAQVGLGRFDLGKAAKN